MRPVRPIRARRTLPAPIHLVAEFLHELDNHRHLSDGRLVIVDLHGAPGARTGARIELRGPFGVTRSVETRVLRNGAGGPIVGHADTGSATATVTWSLTPVGSHTEVELAAGAISARGVDLVLLRVGRVWVRRRFDAALRRLGDELARGSGAARAAAQAR